MKIFSIDKALLGAAILMVLCPSALGDMNGPEWPEYQDYEKVDDQVEFSEIPFSAYPVFGGIVLYQKTVSSVSSAGCPSYPSCSRYMQMSFRDYGAAMGFMMGMGRLLHESGELTHGRWILTEDNKWLVYDPPSANAILPEITCNPDNSGN